MVNLVTEISKYLMLILIGIYTFGCFTVFSYQEDEQRGILRRQNILMFMIHFMAFLIMFLRTEETKVMMFYGMQVVLLGCTIFFYTKLYPRASRLVVNNMCMLLAVGLIMLTRINYDLAWKQFIIVSGGMALSLLVPVIIRKVKFLANLRKFYGIVGVIALLAVIVVGRVSNGAILGFEVAGISIQPSELVKIVFVFFVAASFYASTEFKNIVITTAVAAAHVLILVASTDLGAAVIIFVVYLVMLYVATRQPLYMLAGLGAGSGASVVAYHLFSHVKIRVVAWQDPIASYDNGGYQVAQSLFAIGTGGWFGMGLFQGSPMSIPVRESDFIFSALSEEMGLIFALCLVLIFLSCYIMFLNIAMQLKDRFYKLVALGLGTCYIFQVFLNIGGVIKFIPSTGVTLPLVSYGGSSIISTLIMFGIIQGLYILREDEEEDIERKKQQRLRAEQKQRDRDLRSAKRSGSGTGSKNAKAAAGQKRKNVKTAK